MCFLIVICLFIRHFNVVMDMLGIEGDFLSTENWPHDISGTYRLGSPTLRLDLLVILCEILKFCRPLDKLILPVLKSY